MKTNFLLLFLVLALVLTGCGKALLKIDKDLMDTIKSEDSIPLDCRAGAMAYIADVSQDRDLQFLAQKASRYAPVPETELYKKCYTLTGSIIVESHIGQAGFITGLGTLTKMGVVK